MDKDNRQNGKFDRYVTPLAAWALAFGCAVGWGAFMMPGNTFLPMAGPIGTVIGIVIGGIIMIIIGFNYHYMINLYPDAGGAFAYTKREFGYDHGFLCAWFLILTYVAIMWANATALPLLFRKLLGGTFQFGFHYTLFGFDIWFGEVMLAIAAIMLAALVCFRNRLAKWVQIVMAIVLLGGIIFCFAGTWAMHKGGAATLQPAFSPDRSAFSGVFTIVFLAPWAFVGFESISHSSEEFGFSAKKSGAIMISAVIAAILAYALMALNSVAILPSEYSSWTEYFAEAGNLDGVKGVPTFYATQQAMGTAGEVLLAITCIGGIVTGLIGNYIASSRLIYALAEDGIVPGRLGELSKGKAPRNAILVIMIVSVIIPFFGRTATSWIVDVTTVGAAIAYAYTSAAAYRAACEHGNKRIRRTGAAGIAVSCLFALYFLVPNLLDVTTLGTESYFILAAWSILGFAAFYIVFRNDTTRRFGRSMVVWIALLGLVYFTSTVWMKQATTSAAEEAIGTVDESVLENLMHTMRIDLIIHTVLILIALGIMFLIFRTMRIREQQIEVEKAMAEEVSRAKTSFLSNMSHEIRTPMNAIIGLDNIALKDPDVPPRTRDHLEKIGQSARHLLGLINDILDMSRIESGRMVLKNEDFAMKDFLDQVNIIINGQCQDKGLDYECQIVGAIDDYYVGDDMKLKQVLINILGNSVKFTPAPGRVFFTVEQIGRENGKCTLRFTMRDTGIGMDKEYIPKIFEAFSQEDATTTNRYGGSGLGMAITSNLVGMMGGRIDVESEKGVGSTFTVTVALGESDRALETEKLDKMLGRIKVIVVDDDPVACEHARLVLDELGVETEICGRSSDAFSMIKRKWDDEDPYDIVITDYRMPVMDGITLAEEIRRFDDGKTAIIIMTGYDFDAESARAHREGVDGILTKPLFTDTLQREIQMVMRGRKKGLNVQQPEQAAGEEDFHLEGHRVLIAEDVDINAEIIMDILEMEGVECERAGNGQAAVDMFGDSDEGHYDAVLMDIRMPVMDGLTATAAIRAMERADAKKIPIIALTANAFDEDVNNSLEAGMNTHLSKPVEPERLYSVLSELIHNNER